MRSRVGSAKLAPMLRPTLIFCAAVLTGLAGSAHADPAGTTPAPVTVDAADFDSFDRQAGRTIRPTVGSPSPVQRTRARYHRVSRVKTKRSRIDVSNLFSPDDAVRERDRAQRRAREGAVVATAGAALLQHR